MYTKQIICCCDDIGYLRDHTGTAYYWDSSRTQHQLHYSCCSGYVMQTHSFALKNGQLICACGRVKDLDIDINATQKNEIA